MEIGQNQWNFFNRFNDEPLNSNQAKPVSMHRFVMFKWHAVTNARKK